MNLTNPETQTDNYKMADTESGSPSEEVFKKFGYTELGKVPRFSLNPTGELKDATFFYNDLGLA